MVLTGLAAIEPFVRGRQRRPLALPYYTLIHPHTRTRTIVLIYIHICICICVYVHGMLSILNGFVDPIGLKRRLLSLLTCHRSVCGIARVAAVKTAVRYS